MGVTRQPKGDGDSVGGWVRGNDGNETLLDLLRQSRRAGLRPLSALMEQWKIRTGEEQRGCNAANHRLSLEMNTIPSKACASSGPITPTWRTAQMI